MSIINTNPNQKITRPLHNLASGWYVALTSDEVKQTPVKVRLFSKDLVVWRHSGKPVVMSLYCIHMGASLAAGGRVVNGCIVCPFHAWSFNSDGNCVAAPDVEVIPKTAYQPTLPAQERYGYIWVWYGTPEPLYQLPDIPELERERKHYLPIRFKIFAKTTARKVLENNYDQSHLKTIHKAPVLEAPKVELVCDNSTFATEFSFSHLEPLPTYARFGGIIRAKMKQYTGITGVIAKRLGLNFESIALKMESWPTGHIITVSLDNDPIFVAYIAVSPIEEELTIQRFGIQIAKTGSPVKSLGYYVLFGLQNYLNARQDKPIWDNMTAGDNGVYVKNDRSVLEFRKFYQRAINEE